MKTSRYFRIFMILLDTVIMFLLRPFRRFNSLKTFSFTPEESSPHPTPDTEPSKERIDPLLEVDGVVTDSYQRRDPISVDPEYDYSKGKGIYTFKGDHKRSGGSFGHISNENSSMSVKWSIDTGKLQKGYGKGFWTGSGWTGQPLIIKWDESDKKDMDLPSSLKEDRDFTEVIYSTMDGKVYFLDLRTGERTRPDIDVGLPFKGAGAIDPDHPLLHLGPGDSGPTEDLYARGYLYSLENSGKLLEYGGKDPFSKRIFCGFDSSPLFFNDYMIEPSENGIIYSMKLNSSKDSEGHYTISPSEFAKLRYTTYRSSEESYWLGMEDSSVIWKNYMYIADNGGTLLCIDLNTMKVIWVQDVVDDTNGSPVLSIEEGHPYLYIGTSLHWSPSRFLRLGDCPVFKIDAVTGEYVWIHEYFCNTVAGISGGVQATPAIGSGQIDDIVIFPLARTPSVFSGILVALDKKTGKEVWRYKMKHYAWSSPVLTYSDNGKPYLFQCDSGGNLHKIDPLTGKLLSMINLGDANIEATPAIFDNTLVVGTRGMKIFGVEIS